MALPDDYERILIVKPEVMVYKIGPRPNNRGYRANDWTLLKPDWTGRLRIVSKSEKCLVRLEDRFSGDLFGECPVNEWPSPAVESVLDSSRYFVLRLCDPTGRHAFVGIGFTDRGDSFDFNVAISDHFKWVKQSKQIEKDEVKAEPAMDLSFKTGQTIKINIAGKNGSDVKPSPKVRATSSLPFTGILPPPPGAKPTNKKDIVPSGPLYRAAGTPMPHNVPAPSPPNVKPFTADSVNTGNLLDDDWGDFSSSGTKDGSADWVNFS